MRHFGLDDSVDRSIGLHTRVGVVLTALVAAGLLLLAGLWLQGTRNSVHEEVEAATRVSRQWLQALIGEMAALPAVDRETRVLAVARGIGRVRANVLEIRRQGELAPLHVSPPSPYKAGREAPAWFAGLLTPHFAPVEIAVDTLTLTLRPDPSRAVLDAWDEIVALGGWALLLLLALFIGARLALQRALRPLDQVMAALDRTGQGRFDTRLPRFSEPELDRLARAFNGMADRLAAAVDDNVRLETERELAECLQVRLEAERRDIARELHDELAQGITAVRALAGAIAQRSGEQPALNAPAQSIVAVTGAMQEGVRNILLRLRPMAAGGLESRLQLLLDAWRQRHDGIALEATLAVAGEPLPELVAQAVLRVVQEGLTNILRHAAASRVALELRREPGALCLTLADDGRGCDGSPSAQAGSGIGLAGMRERLAQLGGRLEILNPPHGGFVLRATLPLREECVS